MEKKAEQSALDAANLLIQQNQQAIALLAPANISKLNEQLESNTSRIEKLNKEVKVGLATQAALAGLFQPYNVGKVNVTAAVGGYKSKSAVAVGMGYRVNTKFAAKAGVAVGFGKGNAAYNVGVNYEF
ncbi:hypothetical protein B0186_07485 [Canicola haemoglobinophilus]|uniref:Trimeric autotransporter adhesin hada n=1 Tax=Canicola haemoglobinophilus TaxID=733 RepID=A0A1V4B048_9PAST|nr:YadA C-terminal domain-containing protein [Canicola haemoglobinophilus]OOR99459.1 hypothetical protein B0186_07485 [Canicola haemoglobinophilus]STO59761.1 trimeric autotransporter adhesin hada [Canicola haemoglobinophilus]